MDYTWQNFATHAATARNDDGSYRYTIADTLDAAVMIERMVKGRTGDLDLMRISQLFAAARMREA